MTAHYSVDQVMTAICIAEAMVRIHEELTEGCEELDQLFEQHGTFTMREAAIRLVGEVDTAWEAAQALGVDCAFDFEFCFEFVRGAAKDGRIYAAIRDTYGSDLYPPPSGLRVNS